MTSLCCVSRKASLLWQSGACQGQSIRALARSPVASSLSPPSIRLQRGVGQPLPLAMLCWLSMVPIRTSEAYTSEVCAVIPIPRRGFGYETRNEYSGGVCVSWESISFGYPVFNMLNVRSSFVLSGWLLSGRLISVLNTVLAGTQLHTLKYYMTLYIFACCNSLGTLLSVGIASQ